MALKLANNNKPVKELIGIVDNSLRSTLHCTLPGTNVGFSDEGGARRWRDKSSMLECRALPPMR